MTVSDRRGGGAAVRAARSQGEAVAVALAAGHRRRVRLGETHAEAPGDRYGTGVAGVHHRHHVRDPRRAPPLPGLAGRRGDVPPAPEPPCEPPADLRLAGGTPLPLPGLRAGEPDDGTALVEHRPQAEAPFGVVPALAGGELLVDRQLRGPAALELYDVGVGEDAVPDDGVLM